MKSALLACLMVAITSLMLHAHAEVKPITSAGTQVAVAQRAAAPHMRTEIASSDAKTPPQKIFTDLAAHWSHALGGVLFCIGLGSLLSISVSHQVFTHPVSTLLFVLLGLFLLRNIWRGLGRHNPVDDHWTAYVPEVDARIESVGLQLPLPDEGQEALLAQSSGDHANEHILGFEVSVFVNHAKTRFISLQLAWDQSDFHCIRSFTTPAMYVALRRQAQVPGRLERRADVVQLFGTLLAVRVVEKEYIASVSFKGLMKPLPDASAEPFSEIWHISRPLAGKKGWALAGIQKIS